MMAAMPAECREPVAEPVKVRIGSEQQPACAMAGGLVMVVAPRDAVPFVVRIGFRMGLRARSSGGPIPCHCLSVPAFTVRLIAAAVEPVDR